jgi:hypothetical protein
MSRSRPRRLAAVADSRKIHKNIAKPAISIVDFVGLLRKASVILRKGSPQSGAAFKVFQTPFPWVPDDTISRFPRRDPLCGQTTPLKLAGDCRCSFHFIRLSKGRHEASRVHSDRLIELH